MRANVRWAVQFVRVGGAWRSLVARLLWEQEVLGSNPGAPTMATYHHGSRELQDRFDTRRLADRLDERFVQRASIGADDRAFIERMDMFFLATADADGSPQCSYKGGDPGFVRVLDEHTVMFPNYDGNGMFLSMGNLLVNPRAGMLFIDFAAERPSRLASTALRASTRTQNMSLHG